MSTQNTVAERLLTDARRKTARQESPALGRIALAVGVIAVLVSPISIAGWVLGTTALGSGALAARRPASRRPAKVAMVLGVAAVFVGVFFYTLNIAMS